jgi:arginyl-tRNA synthetase
MKKLVVDILEKTLKSMNVKISREQIEEKIEIPPSIELGDYAFPCFIVANQLELMPHEAALEIRKQIGTPNETDFDDIQTQGPYINFFLDRKNLARKIVWEAISKRKEYGKTKIGKGKRVVVEFSSPNIAKPFGIGHLRSTIIGNSLAKIHEFLGYKVTRINYLGDWGTQFGKIMLGFEEFGSDKKLLKNPIEHLLQVYVKANKKKYEKEAREWFKRLEDKDKKALMLWKLFRTLSIKEFEKIYTTLGVKFDVYSGESESVKSADEVLKQLEKKKLVHKSKGALIVDLKQYGLDVCIIKKSDDATTYVLRDLAAAIKRHEKYNFEKMLYEVGQEQTLYFRQLFKILELLGYKWAKDCVHVDHGLYLGKSGKRFATRKGNIIFMKDILDETISLAGKELKKRAPKLRKTELERRARAIAIAAIFYGDLKNNRKNNMVFDINRFISFDGDTGPYILYSYARASSILKKAQQQDKFEILELDTKELELVQKLLKFENVVTEAYRTLSPSVIANYCYQISKTFNEFYHVCPVVGSKEEAFRLALVEAFRIVLKNSLSLLGIETLEKM